MSDDNQQDDDWLISRVKAIPDIAYRGLVEAMAVAVAVAGAALLLLRSRLSQPVPLWVVIGIIAALTAVGAIVSFAIRRSSLSSSSLDVAAARVALEDLENLAELDASILRLIPSLVLAEEPETAMAQLMDEFLRDCRTLFNQQVRRLSVFLPTDGGEYLAPKWTHEMPEASRQRTRCTISAELPPGQLRGVVGHAHMVVDLQVAHMLRGSPAGAWHCDHPQYINFDRPDRVPQYLSFAAVPLIGDDEGPPLGVLCLDSMDADTFDSEPRQDVLWALADRAADVLAVYGALRLKSSRDGGTENATKV